MVIGTAADGAVVKGFDIEATNGDEFEFTIDQGQYYGFDLRHLQDHRVSRQPVIVQSVVRDGKTYATSIVDA